MDGRTRSHSVALEPKLTPEPVANEGGHWLKEQSRIRFFAEYAAQAAKPRGDHYNRKMQPALGNF